MHIPPKAPTIDACLKAFSDPEWSSVVGDILSIGPLDDKQRYSHWDKIRFKPHPKLTSEQWWAGLKYARFAQRRSLALGGIDGKPLWWCEPDIIAEKLHWLDVHAAGAQQRTTLISEKEARGTYLVRSLYEEAISSSQLEGASTTRLEAKAMLRENREPIDTDQAMILNNYRAMEFMRSKRELDLTPELILELHRIVTENTLDNPNQAGQLRTEKDDVNVIDNATGDILFTPPPAKDLAQRLVFLSEFANGQTPRHFVHPLVRAILVHFLLAYDHPFVDGNGRTARALFYWVAIREGYWLLEYTTISKVIKAAPKQYGQAFLQVETDENDMTYFIDHQLGVITRAVEELHEYLEHQQAKIRYAREQIARNPKLQQDLNTRQLALLRHAIKNPRHAYVIEDHQRSHGVTYDTARRDLLKLSKLNLLDKVLKGKGYIFTVPPDLQKRLG